MSDFEKTGNIPPQHLDPYSGFFDLSRVDHFDHVVDPETGTQYLSLHDGVEYPEPRSVLSSDLFLDQMQTADRRILRLPKNFVTMAQALNDTIGNSPNAVTLELARTLFSKLGDQVSVMAKYDDEIPENIHYRQIIVVKDSNDLALKFLPPLKLQPLSDEVYSELDTKTLFTHQLFSSCYYGASNKSQRSSLPIVFKGFIDAFKGKR